MYNVSNQSWSPLYTGFTKPSPNTFDINYSGLRVDGNNIIIYFIFYENSYYYFRWVVRTLNNGFVRMGNADLSPVNWKIYSTQTINGLSHTAYYYQHLAQGGGYTDLGIFRSNDGTAFPIDQIYEYVEPWEQPTFINLSSAGNEVHVIWQDEFGQRDGTMLRYKYDDLEPLAPQNLAISINSSDETVLTWNANTEPDVRVTNGKYKIYRAETDLNGNILPYQLVVTINAINGTTPVTSWIDQDAMKSTVRKLYYKITAMDINQHESLFSNIVWRFGRLGKITTNDISNFEYRLYDNYPNPFNPNTKISYSIKEEGLVTLKVHDVLGKEIATLVNENKPEGNYEVDFNASQLPSGMYIYKLQAGSFSDVKKMLLTK